MAIQAAAERPTSTDLTAPKRNVKQRSFAGLWFVAPFVVVYAAFLIWPLVSGFGSSFFNTSLAGGETKFLGLDNYAEMINDDAVWTSLWHTLLFTLLSTPPLIVLSLAMALLAHRAKRSAWFLRFAFFMPFLLPATVVTLIWIWLYQPEFGLFNNALSKMGFTSTNWIGDERTAMVSVVLTTVWWTVGFNFLLYLAALQSIPQEIYEAAHMDGASGWQRLLRITEPLLRRTTVLILILQLVASLKVFDQIYLMNNGIPNFAVRPVIQYIYDEGFTSYRVGYASAISYLLFAIIVLVAFTQFKLFPAGREDKS